MGNEPFRPKVLIVDDDEHLLTMLKYTFEDENYDLLLAPGGREALELVGRERPHLILLDISMPLVSGFEVLRALKSDPATAGIPVIIITSCDMEKDVVQGFELGASDYITKPFSLAHLVARARTWLSRSGYLDGEGA